MFLQPQGVPVESIEIDRDVYKELQVRAVPFVDTPNTVLRRLLNLDADLAIDEPTDDGNAPAASVGPAPQPTTRRGAPTRGRAKKPVKGKDATRTRAPSGALLPEDRYETPLLIALAERGGSASSRDVIASVGEQLADDLMPMDKESLKSGGIRWQSRVQFVRLRLIERGLVEKDTPRGTWGLTEAGMTAAKEAAK
jgi:hypothetical protein